MHRILFTVSCLALLAFPMATYAQGLGTGPSISSSPRFPEPGETVTLSLDVYTLSDAQPIIEWFIDGQPQEEMANSRSLMTTAGALGTQTIVEARVTTNSGAQLSVFHTITPAQIDIVLEADTTVPTFYKGRPLPSIGSPVRAIAIPNLGDTQDTTGYSYAWKVNNQVIGGGSRIGGNVQTFTMPMGREVLLQVDIADPRGQVVGSESVVVPNIEPELYFYPDNPLRGLSAVSTGREYLLLFSEVDMRAEPYYLDTNLLNVNPVIKWKVNSQTVENPSSDPQVITLQNAGGSGRFSVSFEMRNRQQLLQGAEDSFVITF